MKFSRTVAVAFAAFLLTDCAAANAGGPLARLMRRPAKPVCCPTPSCLAATSSQSAETMDQPSELNIMLTTELVALRKQLEVMEVQAAEKDQAIEEAEQLVGKLGDELSEQKTKLGLETKRADAAKDELAKVRNASIDAQKLASQAEAKANQQIGQLEKQNATLKQSLQTANRELKTTKQALAKEKKERDEERRQNQDKAIEPQPAAVQEENAPAGTDATQDSGDDKEQ